MKISDVIVIAMAIIAISTAGTTSAITKDSSTVITIGFIVIAVQLSYKLEQIRQAIIAGQRPPS